MKAAITDGKGRLWLEEVPRPEPGEYQCLCKMAACATCTGTDQKHLVGKLPFPVEYPAVLGHESVGVVIQVGPGVRYLREGDRVLRAAGVLPGQRLGAFFSAWGGFAEYGLVEDRRAWMEDKPGVPPPGYSRFHQVVPAELGLSDADATMLITLKEAASYVASMGVRIGHSVAVLGAGAVGISMCRFAKCFGADPVMVVARREAPLAQALRLGADASVDASRQAVATAVRELTAGRGADFILDTTGDAAFLLDSLPALATDGKAAAYATYAAGDTIGKTIPAGKLVTASPAEDLAHAYMLDAVKFGWVKPSDFYSHRLPLKRIVEGFEMLKRKEAFKIVFEME